jgi:hypothetical protein
MKACVMVYSMNMKDIQLYSEPIQYKNLFTDLLKREQLAGMGWHSRLLDTFIDICRHGMKVST